MGRGAQGAAHLCKLDFRDDEYVDKSVTIYDSDGYNFIAQLWRMYSEFLIGKDLEHPQHRQISLFHETVFP